MKTTKAESAPRTVTRMRFTWREIHNMAAPKDDTDGLLAEIAAGEQEAIGRLLAHQRSRLKRLVLCRMDARIAARIDPSDVVQETLIVASREIERFARERPMPFYPWLRRLAWQRLVELQRKHLGAGRRSIAREESAQEGSLTNYSVQMLAKRLVSREPSPEAEAQKSEDRELVKEALTHLDKGQREILLLRYVEGLTLNEVAHVLGIRPKAARMRHLRALQKLREYLE